MAMEGLKGKAIAMLMMVMLTQLSLAENLQPVEPEKIFALCYPICFGGCLLRHEKVYVCTVDCLRKCIHPADAPNRFCKLGCSMDRCLGLDNVQDAQKMNSCVNRCSTDVCNAKN